jgi:hypothetical protein
MYSSQSTSYLPPSIPHELLHPPSQSYEQPYTTLYHSYPEFTPAPYDYGPNDTPNQAPALQDPSTYNTYANGTYHTLTPSYTPPNVLYPLLNLQFSCAMGHAAHIPSPEHLQDHCGEGTVRPSIAFGHAAHVPSPEQLPDYYGETNLSPVSNATPLRRHSNDSLVSMGGPEPVRQAIQDWHDTLSPAVTTQSPALTPVICSDDDNDYRTVNPTFSDDENGVSAFEMGISYTDEADIKQTDQVSCNLTSADCRSSGSVTTAKQGRHLAGEEACCAMAR